MRKAKLFISILRIALGWMFFYVGLSYMTSGWSVASSIQNAKTFPWLYDAILKTSSVHAVSGVIEIAFMVIGALLVLGLFTRLVSLAGIALMLFFYFPLLHFPHVDPSYFIIDDHIIYCLILAYLFVSKPSGIFGSIFKSSRY